MADEKKGIDIVLYNRTGSAVTYPNTDTLTTDTTTEGETALFTYGEVVEGTEIDLALADGDQKVSVPTGSLLREATIKKPETLVPEYIKKGVDVAGVIGTFAAGDRVEKTVNLDMVDGDQIVDADPDTVMSRVTLKKPETLVPENIAKGITIAGVEGAAEKAPAGILDGTGTFSVTDAMFLSPPQSIKSSVFMFTKITAISMSQVSRIGSKAFQGCSRLTDINFPRCTEICSSAFMFYNATTPTPIKEAIFPECTHIGQDAFLGCLLSTISFPKCTQIGKGAFSGYSSSSSSVYNRISIAEFPKCTYMGDYAFFACRNLLTASFPVVSYAYSNIFAYCTSLRTAYFPLCSYIGARAFCQNNALRETCFDNVITASDLAFWNVNGWSSLSFPKLQSVGSQCFAYNYWLREIYLPQLASVSYMAFYGCTRVETVSLPKCSFISMLAFASCNALKSLYLLGDSVAQLYGGSTTFASTPLSKLSYLGGYGSIFVKESLLETYKLSAGWSYYANRFVGLTDDEIAQLDAERESNEVTNFDTTV